LLGIGRISSTCPIDKEKNEKIIGYHIVVARGGFRPGKKTERCFDLYRRHGVRRHRSLRSGVFGDMTACGVAGLMSESLFAASFPMARQRAPLATHQVLANKISNY
jgi:hypothetical protein